VRESGELLIESVLRSFRLACESGLANFLRDDDLGELVRSKDSSCELMDGEQFGYPINISD